MCIRDSPNIAPIKDNDSICNVNVAAKYSFPPIIKIISLDIAANPTPAGNNIIVKFESNAVYIFFILSLSPCPAKKDNRGIATVYIAASIVGVRI